jgi:hypothetical protein
MGWPCKVSPVLLPIGMNLHKSLRWQRFSRMRARRQAKCQERRNRKSSRETFRTALQEAADQSTYDVSAAPKISRPKRISITAPRCFSLFKNFEESNQFFNRMHELVRKKAFLFVDLSEVDDLSLDAVLVLLATIKENSEDRETKAHQVTGNLPRETGPAEQLLKNSGFFSHMKAAFKVEEDGSQIGIIAHQNGYTVDTELADRLTNSAVMTVLGQGAVRQGIYVTFQELMANTRQHAVPNKPEAKQWWTLLFRDEQQKVAQFVFFDTGEGILKTIRTKIERFAALLPFRNDQPRLLEELLKGSFRSRTGLSYRGKGLPAINRYFRERKHFNNLRIITNRVSADVGMNSFNGLQSNFRGTLFYWELRND